MSYGSWDEAQLMIRTDADFDVIIVIEKIFPSLQSVRMDSVRYIKSPCSAHATATTTRSLADSSSVQSTSRLSVSDDNDDDGRSSSTTGVIVGSVAAVVIIIGIATILVVVIIRRKHPRRWENCCTKDKQQGNIPTPTSRVSANQSTDTRQADGQDAASRLPGDPVYHNDLLDGQLQRTSEITGPYTGLEFSQVEREQRVYSVLYEGQTTAGDAESRQVSGQGSYKNGQENDNSLTNPGTGDYAGLDFTNAEQERSIYTRLNH